jgi:hypothetical protein
VESASDISIPDLANACPPVKAEMAAKLLRVELIRGKGRSYGASATRATTA